MAADLTGDAAPLPFGLAGAAQRLRERPLACWLATCLLVVCGAALRWLTGPGPAPFLPFYPAVILATMVGGRPTGYFAVAVSGLIADFWFLTPERSFALSGPGLVALALYVAISIFAVEIVVHLSRRADLVEARHQALSARAEDLARREARASASLSELEALYDKAPIGLGFLDRDLRFVRINQSLAEMNGPSPADHLGRCVWDIVPDLRPSAEPVLRRVLETGEVLPGVELIGETPARPGEQRHWVEMFYPVRGETGSIEGVGICCAEVTEIRQAHEREQLLMREVDHRAKNLLTVVQSVLHLSRSAASVEDYRAAVTGRIQALGRVHTILADNRWDGVPIADLMRQELAPYGLEVTIVTDDEDAALLPPSPAQAVSMILHELATNSAKHGALAAGGRVALACTVRHGRMTLSWTERGGPPVQPPARNGFGTLLIQTAVKRLLGGTLDYRLEPEGLTCEIAFPLPRARERGER